MCALGSNSIRCWAQTASDRLRLRKVSGAFEMTKLSIVLKQDEVGAHVTSSLLPLR